MGILWFLSVTVIRKCSNLLLLWWKENEWVFYIPSLQEAIIEKASETIEDLQGSLTFSFFLPNNNLWVPVHLSPCLSVLLPPPLSICLYLGRVFDLVIMCKWSLVVTHTFLFMEFLSTEIIMEDWFFFSLMFEGNMSILFLSKYRTNKLVCMLLLLSEFPP